MLTQIRSQKNVLCLVGLFLLFATAVPTWAASTVTNKLTISETLTEKVACLAVLPKVWDCDVVAGDSYTISATVLLKGVNIKTFTGATAFDLRVGGLHVSHSLGEDLKYTTNKTSATFVSSYLDSKNKKVIYQTVILKWTTSQLTVSINGKTALTTTPGWAMIQADEYAGDDSAKITAATTGSISFGATSVTFDPLPITGTVVTKPTKGKNATIYKTSTVKIKGTTLGAVVVVPVIPGVHVTLGAMTASTNLTIGSQGRTIGFSNGPLNGVTVSVPVGALPSNMSFTVSEVGASLTPEAGTFSGHVIDLHVGGTPTNGTTAFEQPIGITIPFANDGTAVPVPYYIDTNGFLHPAQVVSIDNQSGHLTFETFHASPYTWLYASLTNLLGDVTLHNATTYFPWVDGFQVGNPGSVYNPGGECFGITAFAQWYFREKGGGFYPKYMQAIPLGAGGGTIKGQEVIRTRAFNSVSRLFSSYVPRRSASFNLTPAQRYASICNILINTKVPTILSTFGHSILVYDFYSSGATNGVLLVNDPNYPGTAQLIRYDPAFSNRFQYVSPGMTWSNLAVMGDGSFLMEGFDSIYLDAEDNFHGNGAAQVAPTSHTNGQAVTQRNITFSGNITNGQVIVSKLNIVLNGTTIISTPVTPFAGGDGRTNGHFSAALTLNVGTNTLSFQTIGYNGAGELLYVLNTQKDLFKIIGNMDKAAILVTLTWNTSATDIDLYTIDPTGNYSAYYQHTTADGGNLDVDNTSGYGPEHWTLTYANTVRWGQDYKVRVHYYSDHQVCSSCVPPVEVRPTSYTVTVLLYEGTPQMETHTYSGVLGSANSSTAHSPASTGPDWADVVTITPVQPGPGRAASVRQTESGEIRITVPIPSPEECLRLKLAPELQR